MLIFYPYDYYSFNISEYRKQIFLNRTTLSYSRRGNARIINVKIIQRPLYFVYLR